MKKDKSAVKRTIKYLSICNDKQALNAVLRKTPDSVIKKLCDIALNALKGDVSLTTSQKRLFRKHKSKIAKLTDRAVPIDRKRTILQDGGFAWIPAIIGAVLGTLGTGLLGGSKQ
jgi:hypothetical protein